MGRKLYYFNSFITYNNQVTNIHLSSLLDNIRVVEPEYRIKNLKQGNMCLMHMKEPQTNRYDENDRKVVIGKFREIDKPFISNLGTDRIDEIFDDIVELTSIFYRANSRLLIVEYNHYGMRPSALEGYLNYFLPSTEDNSWSVSLEPIEPDLGFNDISQSEKIKNVEFKVDLTARNPRIYNEQQMEDFNRSVLGNILTESIETHQEFGANFATVGFSNGKKWRRNVINPEQLVNLMRAIDLDSDAFESIKIKYDSPATGKEEELDLKDQGVLKGFLDIEENGWEYICDNIEYYFYNQGRVGQNEHLNYEIDINANLPNLIFNWGN